MKASLRSAGAGAALRSISVPEQAAAVCFRHTREGVELLLVRTGSGRWTFTKGLVEMGESLDAEGAREAREEAVLALIGRAA